jgi:putative spermidine/putrescine transport system permease protein
VSRRAAGHRADRGGSGAGTVVARVVAVLAVGPLLVLPVWAAADVWRAPALLPQEWGTRGLEVALAPGTRAVEATANSLLVAVVATLLALAVGWSAARWLADAPTGRRVGVLVVLALPLLVPQLAIGSGLATWFIRLGIADTLGGIVLAHLVAVLPYTVVALAPGFSPAVRDAEEAARTLGAGPARVLWSVTLPMLRRPVAVAALLGGLVSWSQYGTSLGVGGGIPMLPLVFEPFVARDRQVAAVLALVTLAVPLLALVATTWRPGRSGSADQG